MKTDGVSTAFELISEEIIAVANEIQDQGIQAFKNKNHTQAKNLAESAESLEQFQSRVEQLREDWQSKFDLTLREKVKLSSFENPSPQPKSKKTTLKITFSPNTSIYCRYAVDTFIEALQYIGLDKVESLKIKNRGLPLVGKIQSSKYQQRKVDDYFITVHSSTHEKIEFLELIGNRLSIALYCEAI